MALNIKNAEVERLAAEIAERTHQTKTETIRRALEEYKQKMKAQPAPKKKRDIRKYLERHVWPFIPPDQLGRKPLTKEEIEEILGIGPDGY